MELRLHRHGEVDSTSERAFAALDAGTARHGDVHVAGSQSAGRGRRGAGWYSPPGEGLYLSAVLRPPASSGGSSLRPEAPSLAGVLAVRAALAELGLDQAAGLELKWPNDLLVRGAKLSGVLAESRGLDPARPHCVLGIGINVRQRGFPAELLAERPVTSLALLGIERTPEDVLAVLVPPLAARIERCLDAPEELAREYLEATGLAGAAVRVRAAGDWRAGRLVACTLERGLELEPLELPGGTRERIALGHVQALERAAP